MCNLYSITTNQEAIRALFRVVNRYVGNLAPMPGVFPDYPAPVIRNTDTDTRDDPDALGHAAATAHRRAAGHERPQHVIAALARLVEAGEPQPGPGQQLRRVRTGAALADAQRVINRLKAKKERIAFAPLRQPFPLHRYRGQRSGACRSQGISLRDSQTSSEGAGDGAWLCPRRAFQPDA